MTFRVDKPKEVVYRNIVNATKIHLVEKDFIQIVIKPSFFDPFVGRGYINLKLSDSDNFNMAKIECEIVPSSFTKGGIYILSFLLLALTLVSLFISHNYYSLLMIAFVWIVSIIVCHLTQKLNQGKLENYIRFIISNIIPGT